MELIYYIIWNELRKVCILKKKKEEEWLRLGTSPRPILSNSKAGNLHYANATLTIFSNLKPAGETFGIKNGSRDLGLEIRNPEPVFIVCKLKTRTEEKY